jgi:hypothetical protein
MEGLFVDSHVKSWAQDMRKLKRPGHGNVKRYMRFTQYVDDTLRGKAQFNGDLSRFVDAALTEVDLDTVDLIEEVAERDTQIILTIRPTSDKKLRTVAKRRGCTLVRLANSAIVRWLRDNA